MVDKVNCPIFITGIERSGVSLVARVISMCGVFKGETTEKFENIKLRDLCKDYYSSIGADLEGQYPLPYIDSLQIPYDWKKRVLKRLATEQGFAVDSLWMYKSFRLLQIWPIWNYVFPNAKWIVVRRRTGDVIQSCLKTAYMSAFKNDIKQMSVHAKSEAEGWLWWVHNQEKRRVDMMESGVNVKVVWPERMLDGDYGQIFETIDWLGLKWNNNIFQEIDPLLWGSRNKQNK